MFKKIYKLNGKDVLYLTKRRQFIPAGMFGFFYVKQYPNRKFNQISSHITIKLDKRAVKRRIIKKAIIGAIENNNYLNTQINGFFYKIFIILNKKQLDGLRKLIETNDKNSIINYVDNKFVESFNIFIKKIGKGKTY